MLHAIPQVFANAALPRLVLLVNHVLAAEPVATERLRRHAGRSLKLNLDAWPDLLPPPPLLQFGITPAGLFEWQAPAATAEPAAAADLLITVDAGNPARALLQGLMGKRPAVNVAGDAAFAADVSWVIDNVRWDIRDDLARLFGELPAGELARQARAVGDALRGAAQGLAQRAAGLRESAFGSGGSAPDAAAARPPSQ